jgi:hypothetical protein
MTDQVITTLVPNGPLFRFPDEATWTAAAESLITKKKLS